MRILAYIRVSTDAQADSGAGLEAQMEACNNYAKRQGHTIAQIFRDEGISGAAEMKDRHGLMEALNGLKKGDILLVAKRDRLARDKYAIAFIEREIEKKKARIISAAGEGTDQNDPASRMLSGIVDVFAVYERDVIRARTKAALAAMKREGKRVGHIPFGYRLADDGIHLEAEELEQNILKQMRDLRSDGFSIREIAEEMNKRGAFNRGESLWNHASVHRILNQMAA